MGWTFFHKEPGLRAVDAILCEYDEEWVKEHVVASSATREAVFLVVKHHDPDSDVYVPDADGFTRGIVVFVIENRPKSEYNFGYKDMTESMGPCGWECPRSIIAAASPLRPKPDAWPDEYSPLKSAHNYRERSLALAAARGEKPR